MNADLDLNLEVSCEQIKNILIENIIPIPRDVVLDMEPFPSALILVKLASAVYSDDAAELPKGWRHLTTAFNKSVINGYFGMACWNPSLQQVVISHRGTDITNIAHLYTNKMGVMNTEYTNQMNSAITFADMIMTVLCEVNEEQGAGLQLSLTGHSLGGWLAQVTAFTLEHVRMDDGHFDSRSDRPPCRHVHTVTFDTPGCKQMLDKIIDDKYFRYRNTVTPDHLDITNYLAPPNRINSSGSHVGTIHLVDINVSHFNIFSKYTLCYNIATHKIENFVKAFKDKAKIQEVLDWPASGDELNEIFMTASHETNYVPDAIKNLRYKTEEVGISCNLRIFSEKELYLLDLWSALRVKQLKMNDITFFLKQHNLGSVENLFPGYKKNVEGRCVTCQSKESLQTLVKHTKQLMRWFHPEFLETVEQQSACILNTGSIIYQILAQKYLDCVQKCHVNFKDSIGLGAFLKSIDERILHIESEDGQFQVAVLYNLLSQMREMSHIEPLDTYLRPDHQTFVNYAQMRDLNRNVDFGILYESKYSGDDLLVIDGTMACSDLNFLERFFTVNPHKKVIFISSPRTDHKRFLGLLEVPFKTVPCAQLGLSDLTIESQNELFLRKMLIVGEKKFAFKDYTHIQYVTSLLSHIDSYIKDRKIFKDIVTDQKFCVKMEDPLLSYDDLKVHSTVNKEVSMAKVAQALRECSGNTELVISGIEREQLGTDPWKEHVSDLKGENIFTTTENGESIFKKVCRDKQNSTIYRFSASAGLVHCLSIYQNGFYINRRFHKIIFEIEKFACEINKDGNIKNAIFVFQNTNDIQSLISHMNIPSINKHIFLKFQGIKMVATAEEADDIIKEISDRPVHILEQEANGGSFIWQRSRGSLDGLRPYVSTDIDKSVDEEELCNTRQKVVIIADEPGMGKSTSLTSISRRLRLSAWVIRVDLKDFQIPIQEPPASLSLNSVCEFILKDKDSWLRALLHFCLDKRNEHSQKVCLLFDGFDEINQHLKSQTKSCADEVLKLLEYVNSETTGRIWITTRLHKREMIENKFSVFAKQFERISESRQQKYLVEFWRQHLLLELHQYGNAEKEKLVKCAEVLYENAKQALGDDVQKFMGIPLQMRMLAEIFMERVKNCVESNTDIRHTFDVKSVLELYQQFISLKYEIYFNDKTLLNACMYSEHKSLTIDMLTEKHRLLALRTLFPEFAQQHFGDPRVEWGEQLCRVGLVQADGVGAENSEFVHRTLAEYFCADLVADWLRKKGRYCGHAPMADLLFTEILLKSHNVIRIFVDKLVLSQPLPEDVNEFSGSKISGIWLDSVIQRSLFNQEINTALHIAVLELNTGIIGVLVGGLHCGEVPKRLIGFIAAHNRDRYTALGLAARTAGQKGIEIMEQLMKSVETCQYEVILELLLATYARYTNQPVDELELLSTYIKERNVCLAINKAFSRTLKIIREDIPRLQAAVRDGQVEEVEELYSDMVSDTERRYALLAPGGGGAAGGTILHRAAGDEGGEEQIRMIKILCNQNISEVQRSYNMFSLTPLHWAARVGHLHIIEHFINQGVHIDSLTKRDGETALFSAAEYKNTSVVQYLIKKGITINTLNDKGETALFSAALRGNLSMVQYLIKEGIAINTLNGKGETVLFSAVECGILPVVKYLVENGLAITTVNDKGETALFVAVRFGKLSVVEYLIESGLIITTVNDKGETALFVAIRVGKLSVVEYLIEIGFSITTVNNKGETALDVASKCEHRPIVKFLKEKLSAHAE